MWELRNITVCKWERVYARARVCVCVERGGGGTYVITQLPVQASQTLSVYLEQLPKEHDFI